MIQDLFEMLHIMFVIFHNRDNYIYQIDVMQKYLFLQILALFDTKQFKFVALFFKPSIVRVQPMKVKYTLTYFDLNEKLEFFLSQWCTRVIDS